MGVFTDNTILFFKATDIVNHFRILPDLQHLLDEETYDPTYEDHHELAICLMMTSCDISDQTKVRLHRSKTHF